MRLLFQLAQMAGESRVDAQLILARLTEMPVEVVHTIFSFTPHYARHCLVPFHLLPAHAMAHATAHATQQANQARTAAMATRNAPKAAHTAKTRDPHHQQHTIAKSSMGS